MAKKPKLCCCCDAYAGDYEQHWNRDNGFGLCDDCIEFCARGSNLEDFKRSYGEPGVHYARLPAAFEQEGFVN